jgi:hypothetical protein
MEPNETVVLCPNCRWSARGTDEMVLKAAKDHHALYECPLPAAAQNPLINAVAS